MWLFSTSKWQLNFDSKYISPCFGWQKWHFGISFAIRVLKLGIKNLCLKSMSDYIIFPPVGQRPSIAYYYLDSNSSRLWVRSSLILLALSCSTLLSIQYQSKSISLTSVSVRKYGIDLCKGLNSLITYRRLWCYLCSRSLASYRQWIELMMF